MAQVRDFGELCSILEAIVKKLQEDVEGCTESTCYPALDSDALPMPALGDLVVVVAPSGGSANREAMNGGGRESLGFDSNIIVKIHAPNLLDQDGRDSVLLTDKTRGVLGRATEVLSALTDWSPATASHILTHEAMWPVSYAIGKTPEGTGFFEWTFALGFDWAVAAEDRDA